VQREQSFQPLAGHLVVFTGKLSTLGRKDARALVARLGGATSDEVNARITMLVIGGEGFAGGASTSNKIRRVEELNAQQGLSIQVLNEEQFCRTVGQPTPSELTRQYYATRDLLARYRALREDHLRYLVKYGIIKPVLRTNADTFFAFQGLAAIKQANEEMSAGTSFRSVLRALLASRQGQLTFDFRLDAAPAKIVALHPRPPKTLPLEAAPPPRDAARAEEYFLAASEADDGNEATLDQAAALYRKALECDPYLVAAFINLANIHYTHHEIVEAQALYERVMARFNVAVSLLASRGGGQTKTFLAGKESLNEWCRQAQRAHYDRLRRGGGTLAASAYFLDLFEGFRRINSHVSSIGYAFAPPVLRRRPRTVPGSGEGAPAPAGS